MKKGRRKLPEELEKHYKCIDGFMTQYFKKFWTRYQEELIEFDRMISDCLCEDIISGNIALPRHLPVVKVLVTDVSAFDIVHSTTVENKRKRSSDDGLDVRCVMQKDGSGSKVYKSDSWNEVAESNPKIENTLLKLQCSLDLILKKQVETDAAIIELCHKSENVQTDIRKIRYVHRDKKQRCTLKMVETYFEQFFDDIDIDRFLKLNNHEKSEAFFDYIDKKRPCTVLESIIIR